MGQESGEVLIQTRESEKANAKGWNITLIIVSIIIMGLSTLPFLVSSPGTEKGSL